MEKKVFRIAFVSFFVVLLLVTTGFSAAEDIIVFTNGFLIDGSGAGPVQNAVVVISGRNIQQVGTEDEVDYPEEARVIDLQGSTILPGFINAHVHDAYNENNLQAWAREGVTTVRDLSSRSLTAPFTLRDRFNLDNLNARLVAAGPMLTGVNGYGALALTSVEDARKTVQRLIDDGADLIKIGIEDQQGNRTWPLIPQEYINAIVEVAHQNNLLVSVHVTRYNHLQMALEGGVDELAHMVYNPLNQETLNQVINNDIYWTPTLELWAGISRIFHPDIIKLAINNLKNFVAGGGQVALGTDYDGYSFEFELGMPMKEIRSMAEAGMTPLQIITAATRNAAYVCGKEDELGTIEPGKIADLLIVKGNPLENLEVLKSIKYVVHNGVIIREN